MYACVLDEWHVTSPVAASSTVTGNCPITVVMQPVNEDVNPRGKTSSYIVEILQHAGLFFDRLSPSELGRLRNAQIPSWYWSVKWNLQRTSEIVLPVGCDKVVR